MWHIIFENCVSERENARCNTMLPTAARRELGEMLVALVR